MATAASVTGQHLETTRLDIHELVRQLNTALGPTIVATLAGVRDNKAPIGWAKHNGRVPRPEFERRLRLAHRAMTAIATAEDRHVARAWFIGGNPLLGEDTPMTAIREGRDQEVMNAVQALVDDEWAG